MPRIKYTDISETNPTGTGDATTANTSDPSGEYPGCGIGSALRSAFSRSSGKISVNPSQLRQPGERFDASKLPFRSRRQGIPCGIDTWLGCIIDPNSRCIELLGLESSHRSNHTSQYAEWRRVSTGTQEPFKTASDALVRMLDKRDAGQHLSDEDRATLLTEGRYELLHTLKDLNREVQTSMGAPTCATTSSCMLHEHGFDHAKWDPRRSVLRHGVIFDAMWSDSRNPQIVVAAKSTEDLDRALILRQGTEGCSGTLLSDLTFSDSEAEQAKPAIVVRSSKKTAEEVCEELGMKLKKKQKAWLRTGEEAATFLEEVWPELQAASLRLLMIQTPSTTAA